MQRSRSTSGKAWLRFRGGRPESRGRRHSERPPRELLGATMSVARRGPANPWGRVGTQRGRRHPPGMERGLAGSQRTWSGSGSRPRRPGRDGSYGCASSSGRPTVSDVAHQSPGRAGAPGDCDDQDRETIREVGNHRRLTPRVRPAVGQRPELARIAALVAVGPQEDRVRDGIREARTSAGTMLYILSLKGNEAFVSSSTRRPRSGRDAVPSAPCRDTKTDGTAGPKGAMAFPL